MTAEERVPMDMVQRTDVGYEAWGSDVRAEEKVFAMGAICNVCRNEKLSQEPCIEQSRGV